MTTATQNYTELVGKKVILQANEGDEVVDIRGKLEAANDFGILIKPKGKASSQLIENGEIVSLELDEDAAPKSSGFKLKARRVNPVTESNVRRHLLDGHGVQLSYVNQVTAAQALQAHTSLHEGEAASEIGHFHADKTAK